MSATDHGVAGVALSPRRSAESAAFRGRFHSVAFGSFSKGKATCGVQRQTLILAGAGGL